MIDLPPLRRRAGPLARIGSLLLPNVRSVEKTRESFAAWWDQENRHALASEGPLWLALGDSTSQAIGTSHPTEGLVWRLRDRLRVETGAPWRVLNLSITGAQLSDVADRQLPVFHETGLTADLVTCLAGANDVLTPLGARGAAHTIARLLDDLPDHTVVGRVGSGWSPRKARSINRAIEAERDRLVLFDPWDWPSPRNALASDRFHPNTLGYEYVAAQMWPAIMESLDRAGDGSGR